MDAKLRAVAQECLTASHEGTMDFPAIVRSLRDAGFEGYQVDYRRNTVTYYLSSGDSVELTAPPLDDLVEATFRAAAVEQAVREAQSNAPGYTYKGFCEKLKAAGCAGYQVSFLGRRVLYFGRTAETHTELFPS